MAKNKRPKPGGRNQTGQTPNRYPEVHLLEMKDGEMGAQIRLHGTQRAVPLSEFSQAVQERLAGKPAGTVLRCESGNAPESMVPAELIDVAARKESTTGRMTRARGGSRREQSRQPDAPSPHLNNPYNFAELHGDAAFAPRRETVKDSHHQWAADRLSGVLKLEITAQTPIFVPAGVHERKDDAGNSDYPGDRKGNPARFWRCFDGQKTRLGLPGSSMKGVASAHFEIWTNSRIREMDRELYEQPIPYRRRSAQAWVVTGELPDGGLRVRKYECFFACRQGSGQWTTKNKYPNEPPQRFDGGPVAIKTEPESYLVDLKDRSGWQAVALRANLLWTQDYNRQDAGKGMASHRWTHLLLKQLSDTREIRADDKKRYRDNFKHAHFKNHAEMTRKAAESGLGKNFYKNVSREDLKLRLRDLCDLQLGTVLFAIPERGNSRYIACFGKNVNFLWPSKQAPAELLRGFLGRDEKESNLAGADMAEAVFGFIGDYRPGSSAEQPHKSHPYRGRVRFTTFWQVDDSAEIEASQVGPVLAPAGTKLKSRVTYLPPRPDGGVGSYDRAGRMRGKKLYWHQPLTAEDVLAGAARAGAANGMDPVWLRPLREGARFQGAVHFDNLKHEELGALLVSLCPQLWFGSGNFGIKIGKAKPRGLGSVTVKVLDLLEIGLGPAHFRSLTRSQYSDKRITIEAPVARFRAWLEGQAGGNADTLPFVEDLRHLLKLGGRQREYHGEPGKYGWMPAFENPDGEPNRPESMPAPMPLARNDPSGQT